MNDHHPLTDDRDILKIRDELAYVEFGPHGTELHIKSGGYYLLDDVLGVAMLAVSDSDFDPDEPDFLPGDLVQFTETQWYGMLATVTDMPDDDHVNVYMLVPGGIRINIRADIDHVEAVGEALIMEGDINGITIIGDD